MRLFFMNVRPARVFFAQIGAAVAVALVIAGCGDNYRPVVTPVPSSGPPAQPTANVVAVSDTSSTAPGIVTIIDYSGDSIMTEAPIGPGPTVFTIDEVGATGYTVNSDGTLSNFAVTTSLQAKNVLTSTLSRTAQTVNLMAPSSGLWSLDLSTNVVDLFQGSPEAFKLAVPITATMPVMVAGSPNLIGEREYVLSQNVPDSAPLACNVSPRTVNANGVATPVEIASETTDPAIALDPFAAATGSTNALCPVYAVQSTDQKRLFVLNRGSDTISVINSQNNTLDQCTPFNNQNGQLVTCHPILPLSQSAVTNLRTDAANPGAPTGIPTAPPNGTSGMGAIAGPVYAEYNQATQQIVVADYDGGSISVIDVSLDEYGNDSPTFGTTYTIPVGNTATPDPASVTVLFDGSKAYTANQNDGTQNGTVTVVNLSTHTVEKTLTVVGHPRTVASIQNSEYSKIYVASPDSPYITIIQSTPTVTDLIDTTVLLQGNVLDLRVTTQNGSTGNNPEFSSRVPGYGQPCNLSAGQLESYYGPNVLSALTLGECQEQTLP
jgi:DNA-binding beta-propeller fold protein YncE